MVISIEDVEDISVKCAKKILNESNIIIKSLPGYGNAGLKKKTDEYEWK